MLRTRLIVAIVLVPVVVITIALGGWPYLAGVVLVLASAGGEYAQLMRAGGRSPARALVVVGICLFGLAPLFEPEWLAQGALAAFLIAATFWHLLQFERGESQAAWDWAATVAGVFYIGGLGSFFLAVRELPGGAWWTLTVFPAIWLSDTGAYVVGAFVAGRALGLGRHPLAPRLSPKKTWEGLAAGVLAGAGHFHAQAPGGRERHRRGAGRARRHARPDRFLAGRRRGRLPVYHAVHSALRREEACLRYQIETWRSNWCA
jgi:phosphatidate cytidylyltransferase